MSFVLYGTYTLSVYLGVAGFDKLNEVIKVNEWMNERVAFKALD